MHRAAAGDQDFATEGATIGEKKEANVKNV